MNPHAQRLLLASQQASDPKTDKKNAKAQPKGKCAPKGKAKAKTKAKAKAKNAKTPYAVAFESFKDQWLGCNYPRDVCAEFTCSMLHIIRLDMHTPTAIHIHREA